MTHLFAVGTDFEKGFGTVRGHVSTALASWANWQGDSCHDCPEILDRDERGFNSRVRLQLALAWAWQTSSFCLLIFFITSIAANVTMFQSSSSWDALAPWWSWCNRWSSGHLNLHGAHWFWLCYLFFSTMKMPMPELSAPQFWKKHTTRWTKKHQCYFHMS